MRGTEAPEFIRGERHKLCTTLNLIEVIDKLYRLICRFVNE